MLIAKTFPASSSGAPRRLEGLDVLRGIAILSVVVFHAYVVRPFAGPWWIKWVAQGAEGVGLFFLISAWSLASSWRYRQGRDRRPIMSFWARRFWRIAPLYYVMLLVTGLLTRGKTNAVPHAIQHNPHTVNNLVAHVTFVFGWIPAFQNSWIGVEWSIGAEMTFYLFFPWLITRLPRKLWGAAIVGGSAVLTWFWPSLLTHIPGIHWPQWAGGYLVWAFPAQMVWFLAGLWLFTWKSRPKMGPAWGVAWGIMAIMVANHSWGPTGMIVAWAAPNVLLLWLTVNDPQWLHGLTRNRFLRYIGQRSYSLYLIHWVVLESVVMRWVNLAGASNMSGFWVRLLATVPLSVALSEVAYRWIEQPGMAFGRRWISRVLEPADEPLDSVRSRTPRQAPSNS